MSKTTTRPQASKRARQQQQQQQRAEAPPELVAYEQHDASGDLLYAVTFSTYSYWNLKKLEETFGVKVRRVAEDATDYRDEDHATDRADLDRIRQAVATPPSVNVQSGSAETLDTPEVLPADELEPDVAGGSLPIRVESGTVFVHGARFPLAPIPFRMLAAMAREPERVFSLAQLFQIGRPGMLAPAGSRAPAAQISRLRRALVAAAPERDWLVSEWGRGVSLVEPGTLTS